MSIVNIDTQLLNQYLSVPGTTVEQAIALAQQQTTQQLQTGKIFQPLVLGDDIKPVYEEVVTSGLWTNSAANLTAYFTSSAQTSTQKQYYYSVWNAATTGSGAESQFSIAYGNIYGSGSYSQGQLNDSPTRAIYSQYRATLLNPTDTTFTFYGGVNSTHIYVISIDRARIKERLDAGNWQLSLAKLNGNSYANNVYTGSNVQVSSSNEVITLIDDSNASTSLNATPAGRVYNIYSGSIASGASSSISAANAFGLVYPDLGIIVLNADRLNSALGFNSVTSSFTTTSSAAVQGGDNAFKLFTSISGAAAINSAYQFQGRAEETVKSQVVFVRVKNNDFNFSNNPTFISGSTAQLAQTSMQGDPKVYITTIGLYNSKYELVAVAKLSKPLLKSFNRELLLRVKLDY